MPIDVKKEEKTFYLPPKTPHLIQVPPMRFVAVQGAGDPNEEGGAYQRAIGMLYAVAFTIKMSRKGGYSLPGYVEYVMPPLEGLWWMEGAAGLDLTRKAEFQWISLIRLPDFVTRESFDWAVQQAQEKKKIDLSPVQLLTWEDGLCVQCLHQGPYDQEGATIRAMEQYARAQGMVPDVAGGRRHHEIYLSDPRRCKPENCKTVLRHPVRPIGG